VIACLQQPTLTTAACSTEHAECSTRNGTQRIVGLQRIGPPVALGLLCTGPIVYSASLFGTHTSRKFCKLWRARHGRHTNTLLGTQPAFGLTSGVVLQQDA
jgi:hypothetical protein